MNSVGVLLHPAIGDDYNEALELQGHLVRFMTVDLTAGALDIRKRLLTAAQEVVWGENRTEATPMPGVWRVS